MIRRNEGLNCVCVNPTECRNGAEYCNRIDTFTGKCFCTSIGKVEPIDLDKLNRLIEFINLLGEVSSTSKPHIAGTKRSLTESLFDESTAMYILSSCRGEETKNSPNRIIELIEMGLCIRPVKLSHRVHRIEKPLPRKMSEEEAARFIRACEKLEALREGTYFDVPSFCDEAAPTDASREPQSPVWMRIK